MRCATWAWLGLVSLVLLLKQTTQLPEQLKIGLLYEKEHEGDWRAIEWSVEETNLKEKIKKNVLVLPEKAEVAVGDSFAAQRRVCRMSALGLTAVFGPTSPITAAHVQSICSTFEVPHLQWHWDTLERDYFSISLYPSYLKLSQAYQDAVRFWQWRRFTILYENNDGLARLQKVLMASEVGPSEITVRKIEPGKVDYLVLLKELKDRGEYRFIIDCHVKNVWKFLHAGLKLKMISDLFHYFFTTLDIGLVNLEDFIHLGANITAYRIIDPDRPEVVNVRTSWLIMAKNNGKSPLMEYTNIANETKALPNETKTIPTETALAYDAFTLYTKAMHQLISVQTVSMAMLPCDKVRTWPMGNSLLNYMKLTHFEGLSGTVKFNGGERSDFTLDLVYLTASGELTKAGTWTSKTGLNFTLNIVVGPDEPQRPKHEPYVVAAYVTEPYVIKNASTKSGYSGFCVELLDKIALAKNFTYRILQLPTVGKPQPNGTWNGVMGALIERRADIGIGDLTINLMREKHVDFTKPFLTLGITILYKKPAPKSLNLFSFLSPLSVDVWVYMIAAYLCVSFMLFVIARFSPYEWCNPHPCNPDTDEVENQFTVMNSLWFTIGSLMQQGCEIAPRALSTRLVAGMWWFFTLIMISSYTANLAAFLTVERMVADIESADDLAKQDKIKYGTFDGGATMNFFKDNKLPLYKRMWNFMNTSSQNNFVKNLTQAVERIKRGNYAYITESTTVDYVVQRNCDLMSIGGRLDSKGYGFATPTGSRLREVLTEEILRLKEEQEIEELRERWWEKMLGGGQCVKEAGKMTGKAAELGVENVGGVFVVLMGGVIIGFFVSFCEFIWKANKNAKKDKQTLCSELSEEFRFAVRCMGSKKNKKNINVNEDEIMDNGLQFMPLTGYGQNMHSKEVYA